MFIKTHIAICLLLLILIPRYAHDLSSLRVTRIIFGFVNSLVLVSAEEAGEELVEDNVSDLNATHRAGSPKKYHLAMGHAMGHTKRNSTYVEYMEADSLESNLPNTRGPFAIFSGGYTTVMATLLDFVLNLPFKLLKGEIIPLPTGDLVVDLHRLTGLFHKLSLAYEELTDFVAEKFKGTIFDPEVIRKYVEDKPIIKCKPIILRLTYESHLSLTK